MGPRRVGFRLLRSPRPGRDETVSQTAAAARSGGAAAVPCVAGTSKSGICPIGAQASCPDRVGLECQPSTARLDATMISARPACACARRSSKHPGRMCATNAAVPSASATAAATPSVARASFEPSKAQRTWRRCDARRRLAARVRGSTTTGQLARIATSLGTPPSAAPERPAPTTRNCARVSAATARRAVAGSPSFTVPVTALPSLSASLSASVSNAWPRRTAASDKAGSSMGSARTAISGAPTASASPLPNAATRRPASRSPMPHTTGPPKLFVSIPEACPSRGQRPWGPTCISYGFFYGPCCQPGTVGLGQDADSRRIQRPRRHYGSRGASFCAFTRCKRR